MKTKTQTPDTENAKCVCGSMKFFNTIEHDATIRVSVTQCADCGREVESDENEV